MRLITLQASNIKQKSQVGTVSIIISAPTRTCCSTDFRLECNSSGSICCCSLLQTAPATYIANANVFFRAMLCISVAYAVMWCLCICLSLCVCHVCRSCQNE